LTSRRIDHGNSERVLVLAPTGRDSSAACALFEQAGLSAKSCSGIGELQSELEAGAGAAVISEEALLGAEIGSVGSVFDWVRDQPPWSDFPFIILTTRRDDPRLRRYTLDLIERLRNVTLQERPIQTMTLVSAVEAALRARRRQYEAARYLREREHAANRLEDLVRERTQQLQEANDHLTAARDSLTTALEAAQMRTWNLDLARYEIGAAPERDLLSWGGTLLAKWAESIGDRVLPDDQGAFEAAFKQALATGKFHLECRFVRRDEEVHWIVAEGYLYRDKRGCPLRLAGTVRDVTERRQVEESLRQRAKVCRRHIGDVEALGAPVTLYQRHYRHFAARAAANALALPRVFVGFLAADIRFVRLYNLVSAAQWAGFVGIVRRLAQAMEHEPRRFVAGIENAVQFVRRKAFLARGHQVSGEHPFRQRDMRPLHDGADRYAKRLAAILALVDARPRAVAGELGNPIAAHATARAVWASGPQHLFQMLARRVFVVIDRIAKIGSGAGHVGLPFNSAAILT
jgi:PAS domain-containing protein